MTDKYVERQLEFYSKADPDLDQDNALYRLGTYLEVIECDGNANLTLYQRIQILDVVKDGNSND